MKRRTLNQTDRARIFMAGEGQCHICGGKIQVGEAWEVEHVIALEISGDDTDANLRPAHVKCHRGKTARDAGDIAKAKRREAKHRGFRPRGRSFWSPDWKRKVSGETVRRDR